VDPNDETDLKKTHAIQDKVKISQRSKGEFSTPDWEKESLESKRKELVEIAGLLPDSKGMLGDKEKLNPVMHLLRSA